MEKSNSIGSGSLVSAKGIGLQASDYKVSDIIQLVIHGYGGISFYFEGMQLNPTDRLMEAEIKTIKKIKVEYIEA